MAGEESANPGPIDNSNLFTGIDSYKYLLEYCWKNVVPYNIIDYIYILYIVICSSLIRFIYRI